MFDNDVQQSLYRHILPARKCQKLVYNIHCIDIQRSLSSVWHWCTTLIMQTYSAHYQMLTLLYNTVGIDIQDSLSCAWHWCTALVKEIYSTHCQGHYTGVQPSGYKYTALTVKWTTLSVQIYRTDLQVWKTHCTDVQHWLPSVQHSLYN